MAAALILTTPAHAGYKLMPQGTPVAVAKSTLTVTPPRDWNRLGARIGRRAESWTLDGLTLNDLTFYGGIEHDKPLFYEVDKKNRPLPRFASTMLPPDIAQLFEASYRVVLGTSLMSIDSIAPARFAGADGVRFTYSVTIQGEEVKRHGEARGAVIGGKLYLMSFEAPAIHYFNRDVDSFRALADSAKLVAAQPK
jgi:hypothetical protein